MSFDPTYFIRTYGMDQTELWRRNGATWEKPFSTASDVTDFGRRAIWTINKNAGWSKREFKEMLVPPGKYYPRIWRPHYLPFGGPFERPLSAAETIYVADAKAQLTVFCRELDHICRSVHPDKATLGVYGHNIRNLLVSACTEAEMHWTGVLRANGRAKAERTGDYVLLAKPLRLKDYHVRFWKYPQLGLLRPFARWRVGGKPTQDLPWYNAYNLTKHDREAHFGNATLAQAFQAVAACATLIVAQFGLQNAIGIATELSGHLYFELTPEWKPQEQYISLFEQPQIDWEPISFPL